MKLPNPKGRQKEVIYLPATGHSVVLGTAGSGKTSMAILRGVYLQKEWTNPGEKTLILTYNRMLVSYMTAFEEANIDGLIIDNYHRVARGFLNQRGKIGYNSIINSNRKKEIINQALSIVKSKFADAILERDYNFFVEEIKWIESFGIKTVSDYKEITRIGRKTTKVNRDKRKYIWEVYDEYLKLRLREDYLYDWDDISNAVADELNEHNDDWYYRHVIIDEGQDFTPSMIRSLAIAIPPDGSLTFFGDVAQQIYGSRLNWKDAGLSNAKIWEFRENYRNTKEISDLAIELTKSEYFKDESDLVSPNIVKAAGAKPSLICFEHSQYDWLKRQVKLISKSQQAAILVRKRETVRQISSDLSSDPDIVIRELHHNRGDYLPEQGVMVGTYHSAKGLEFDTVILPFVSSDNWPNPDRVKEIGEGDTLIEDIRLLYVGITRAKTRLILSYNNEPTILLPEDKSLYNYKIVVERLNK